MAHPLLNPGRMISIIDNKWRTAQLPFDDIRVPLEELPDPDSENGPQETLKELEKKWTDLGLHHVESVTSGVVMKRGYQAPRHFI